MEEDFGGGGVNRGLPVHLNYIIIFTAQYSYQGQERYLNVIMQGHIIKNAPSHTILTLGRPVMFRGSYFILSTMQAGTTPMF